MAISRRPLLAGTVAFVGLLAFYVLTMRLLSGSWEAVISQFAALWWLMVPLSIGFGTQVGLFISLSGNKGAMAAGGSSAGLGMVACCAHHIADILPILGFSTLAVVLANYQRQLLGLSLIINLVGVALMLRTYLKHKQAKIAENLSEGVKIFLAVAIVGSLISIGAVKILIVRSATQRSQGDFVASYQSQQKVVGAVMVDASISELVPGKLPKFDFKFNTHSQDLGFAVDRVASLNDDIGRSYTGPKWEGDPPGGHHRSGMLTFSEPLSSSARRIRLSLQDPPVEFFWDILK